MTTAPKAGQPSPYGWPPLLVMRLATAYTGQSSSTLKRKVAAGQLRVAGRCGRALTFRREDLDEYLLGAPADQSAPPIVQRKAHPARRSLAQSGDDLAVARLRQLAKGGAR
jgi:hypothetical protein